MSATDTTATLLTPAGAGAIAVVRVEGPRADAIVDTFFVSHSSRRLVGSLPGRIRYGRFVHAGEKLDDLLACVIADGPGRHRPEPRCVVELCLHGGVRVVERVLMALEASGVVVASSAPCRVTNGESSEENPDFVADLWPAANAIQREVDRALGRARTERAVRFLAAQRRQLPERLAELPRRISGDGYGVREAIRSLLRDFEPARRLIDGAAVAIVGPPNSGKSTLFNRLAGRETAVVSPIAGTTRDWVSAAIELNGVPVTLIDTAGDHATGDDLERQAIHSGRALGASADLILRVSDVTSGNQVTDPSSVDPSCAEEKASASHGPLELLVWNKLDLIESKQGSRDAARTARAGGLACPISALTGAGVDHLLEVMGQALSTNRPPTEEPCFFTERQATIASQALMLPITEADGLRRALDTLI